MLSFKKYREADIETFSKAVEKEEPEEWVWVEGYKGTDKDMKCRDYQYELGKQYDMPEDEDVVECQSGFHLCLKLNDVCRFYDFCNENRFFKVRALVRAEDVRNYGYYTDSYGYTHPGSRKLAAKSIVFTQEITLDELYMNFGIQDWPEEKKKLAHSVGIGNVEHIMRIEKLASLGYSDTFARFLADHHYYDVAVSVGSQPDLSMDMKVWTIFNAPNKRR